jgi:ELWxxDGT repeat protein
LTALLLVLLALEPRLVKDINPVASPGGSGPAAFAALGNVAVFEASDGSERVFWRSDGTPEGTRPLVNTCPGCTDAVEPFARIGDRLFFLAYTEPGARRKSLWMTDGTAVVRLTGELSTGGWVTAQGLLYFVADGELWRSDGTPKGTRLAVELGSVPSQLTAFRGQVWFVHGISLWRSDGTPAGTVLVRKLSREPRILGGVGKQLVFAAGRELWSTDGTLARDLEVLDAVVQGGRLWFVAETKRGQELWISDGRTAQRLTRFSRKQAFFAPSEAMYLGLPRSGLGGRFVFAVHDGIHGPEPWVSDGTPAGTRLLRDLCPGRCAGVDAIGLTHDGRTYFTGTDGVHGRELWVTDGTRVDLVHDVCPGSCDGNPGSLVALEDRVLFAADDGVNGMELWTADGKDTGRLSDFEPREPWVSLHGAALPGVFLFGADDGEHGLELWATAGTETRLVRDLDDSDGGGSFPSALRALGDTVLFFADDGVHGYELWKSDGSEPGTVLVAELVPGEEPSEPPAVAASAVVDGVLYLSIEGALWRTDGTAQGTWKVADVDARELAAFEGKLYLLTEFYLLRIDGGSIVHVIGPPHAHLLTVHAGRLWYFDESGLWKSDGTGSGTEQAVERFTGSLLAPLGNDLIVSNHEGLWATDGTQAGTRGIGPAADPASPWTVFKGRLYYSAYSGGLWTTDGTPEGTEPLDFEIPPVSAFAALGDRLLFITHLPGAPLWETDGTAAGTHRVGDLAPGWIGQWELLAAGPRVFFLAFDPGTGVELWAAE